MLRASDAASRESPDAGRGRLWLGLVLALPLVFAACGQSQAAQQADGGRPGGIAGWVLDVIEAAGYPGVASLVALEIVFPPLPSEAVLLLGGFLAGEGRLSLPGVIAAATTGSLIGALVLYGLGAWLGDARVRHLVRRYGRWLFVKEEDLDRAEGWFERHGYKAVLLGRVVPIVRSLVSVPAGVIRMPLGRFLAYTTLGSVVWNGLSIGLGWWFGERWELVAGYTRYLEYAVVVAAVAAATWFVWHRLLRRGASIG